MSDFKRIIYDRQLLTFADFNREHRRCFEFIKCSIGILVYQVGIGGGVARFFGVAEELVVFVVAVVGHGDERSDQDR